MIGEDKLAHKTAEAEAVDPEAGRTAVKIGPVAAPVGAAVVIITSNPPALSGDKLQVVTPSNPSGEALMLGGDKQADILPVGLKTITVMVLAPGCLDAELTALLAPLVRAVSSED